MMQKIEIKLRPPLPNTVEGLKSRLLELVEAKRAVDEEIKAIRGTSIAIEHDPKICLRCGNEWKPKKITTINPKVCPRCRSEYWNRPYIYTKRKDKKSKFASLETPSIETELAKAKQEVELAKNKFELSLSPPPPAPMSLRERLTALHQQPAAETEVMPPAADDTNRPVTGALAETSPASDGADYKPNESEEIQESLSDA